MSIYEVTSDAIRPLGQTTFRHADLRERADLQRLLRDCIEVIAPGCLVIAEEFGEWEDSRRRIDILAIDEDANLVVIELKRTEDGGHMELQALRYAAMVSTMTFEQAVRTHEAFLNGLGKEESAEEAILQHLGWEEPDEDAFAQAVRIVLASAQFSRELTSAVLWLNDQGIDIRCVRLIPYADGPRILLDVQQVIPLPEAEEFQVRVREKARREQASRRSGRDLTKYDVIANGQKFIRIPKREAVLRVVHAAYQSGVMPNQIWDAVTFRKTNAFRVIDQEVQSEDEFIGMAKEAAKRDGVSFDPRRFYTREDQLLRCHGKTYAVANGWGKRGIDWIHEILDAFPQLDVKIQPHDSE